jgi:Domain of unknown function (DUF4401)
MIGTAHDLVRELRARGLVTAEPATAEGPGTGSDRPWYIGLLLGTAGWFAGVFALVFVFMLFKPDSAGSGLVAGVVLFGAAWGLFMADREGAFVSQLALALSIAGQFAALFGIHELFFKGRESIAGIAAIALVLQALLVLAMPNRLHRTMSTLFACTAWAIAVRYTLWDEPGRSSQSPPSLGLVLLGFAIAWLPVGAKLYALIRTEARWIAAGWQALLRPVAIGLIAGLAVATLISYPLDTLSWDMGARARGNWLSLWPLLSALSALGALAGAFALGNRGLMGVCVVAALLHASHFYYAMGTTLLIKSLTMLALGAALLAAAHFLKRGPPR